MPPYYYKDTPLCLDNEKDNDLPIVQQEYIPTNRNMQPTGMPYLWYNRLGDDLQEAYLHYERQ